jgi:hypothetical protein
MSTLNNFIAEVKNGGMASANRYFVEIGGAEQKIGLFCDQAQLPGTQILTTPARVYGEMRETPYEMTFDPVTLSFYVDNDWSVKSFFDTWRAKVIDPYSREIGWYKDYVQDIKIYCYNKEEEKRFAVQLYEAYPKTIGAIQLGYENKDIPKLSVTMQYKYWMEIGTVGEESVYGDAFGELANEQGVNDGGFGGGLGLRNAFNDFFTSSNTIVPPQFLSSFGGFQNSFNNSTRSPTEFRV